MRKNFALLGATIVVCLGTGPALANDKNTEKSIKLAALDVAKTQVSAKSVTTTTSAGVAVKKAIAKKKAKKRRVPERLVAKINFSSQTMNIMVNGRLKHSWKISSGAKGHHTPTGSYKPYYMTSMHYSKKYNNAPMPHSVFFRGGYAVHATGAVRRLGNPASHGCVRLSPGNARKFFKLVQKYSKAGTRIKISGSTPASRGFKKRYARAATRRATRKSWANYGNSYVGNSRRRPIRTPHPDAQKKQRCLELVVLIPSVTNHLDTLKIWTRRAPRPDFFWDVLWPITHCA